MADPTPIETLKRVVEILDTQGDWLERDEAAARLALQRVEALVVAVRKRPCLGVARDGYEDECLTTDAPLVLWCWRCTALAPFGKEGP